MVKNLDIGISCTCIYYRKTGYWYHIFIVGPIIIRSDLPSGIDKWKPKKIKKALNIGKLIIRNIGPKRNHYQMNDF